MQCIFLCSISQICALTQFSLRALQAVPSTWVDGTLGWVFTLICMVSCETLYRPYMRFSKSCPINWIYHRWTPIKMIKRNGRHLSEISSVIAKGLNTYVNVIFQLFPFNTFAKNSVFSVLQHFCSQLYPICSNHSYCCRCTGVQTDFLFFLFEKRCLHAAHMM